MANPATQHKWPVVILILLTIFIYLVCVGLNSIASLKEPNGI